MTEQEWLAGNDPRPMLEFLRAKGNRTGQKLRLFGAVVSRRVRAMLTDDVYRRAIEEAERFAEGSSDAIRLRAVLGEEADNYDGLAGVDDVAYTVALPPSRFDIAEARRISSRVAHALSRASLPDADFDHDAYLAASSAREIELAAHSHLLRCVFANPFRPIPFERGRLTPDVIALARAAYDERSLPSGELDPSRLAVLSDALEAAGCTDRDILDHLRSPAPHARGCWAVDLCLDRA